MSCISYSNGDFLFIFYFTFKSDKQLSTFRRIFLNKNHFYLQLNFSKQPKPKLKFNFANKKPNFSINIKPNFFLVCTSDKVQKVTCPTTHRIFVYLFLDHSDDNTIMALLLAINRKLESECQRKI